MYPEASWATLNPVVTDEDGRIVEVHPVTQIVRPMVAWVTEGLSAPGVRAELGRTAPAALTVMPPDLIAATGIAATATLEELLVVGELTVDGLGTDVVALGEDVVGFSSAVDRFGAAPQAATMEIAMITVTAHRKFFPADSDNMGVTDQHTSLAAASAMVVAWAARACAEAT